MGFLNPLGKARIHATFLKKCLLEHTGHMELEFLGMTSYLAGEEVMFTGVRETSLGLPFSKVER